MALSKVVLNGSTLMDVTDTTAVAADVASGKYFYGADGVKTAGSAAVGGLEYETGTWTPTQNVARAEISFINVHTTRPVAIILADVTGTSTAEESTMIYWAFSNWYDAFGAQVLGMDNTAVYGGLRWAYSFGTSYVANGLNISGLSGSGHAYMDYNVTTAKFFPYGGSSSYTFKVGRTYKWIAVWAPTT